MTDLWVLLLGLVAGVLSGIFGIGGGIVIVPTLVLAFGLTQKTATGTSLAALLLPVGLLAVLTYYRAGEVNVRVAGYLAAGMVVGTFIGARFTQSLPDVLIKRLFGVLLLYIAVRFILGK